MTTPEYVFNESTQRALDALNLARVILPEEGCTFGELLCAVRDTVEDISRNPIPDAHHPNTIVLRRTGETVDGIEVLGRAIVLCHEDGAS